MTSMNRLRHSFGIVSDGEYLYIAGGKDQDGQLMDSVERFDLRLSIWEDLASMNHPRKLCCLLLVNKGGFPVMAETTRKPAASTR